MPRTIVAVYEVVFYDDRLSVQGGKLSGLSLAVAKTRRALAIVRWTCPSWYADDMAGDDLLRGDELIPVCLRLMLFVCEQMLSSGDEEDLGSH